ncbi:hypothetical protein WG66_012786 [Moniliophthora roreri]|nr:hypothetical protein WG66_012786 [Moniliophthora roreri]
MSEQVLMLLAKAPIAHVGSAVNDDALISIDNMPVAELWCIDITGPPSVVTRRIFPINFNPQHNFEDFNQAIRDQLKHQPIGNDEPITLDVWKVCFFLVFTPVSSLISGS